MLDGPLEQHLVITQLTTHEGLKAENDNVTRTQSAANNNPQPMDLSANELGSFQKNNSGKGKGNFGKGNAGTPKTPCPICSKLGHWKKDCLYNTNTSDSSNSKGEGKDAKHENTSTSALQTSNLGAKGVKGRNINAIVHVAKDCPKKNPNLSAIDRDTPNDTMTVTDTSQPANLSGFLLNALQNYRVEQSSVERFSLLWSPESTVSQLDQLFTLVQRLDMPSLKTWGVDASTRQRREIVSTTKATIGSWVLWTVGLEV